MSPSPARDSQIDIYIHLVHAAMGADLQRRTPSSRWTEQHVKQWADQVMEDASIEIFYSSALS